MSTEYKAPKPLTDWKKYWAFYDDAKYRIKNQAIFDHVGDAHLAADQIAVKIMFYRHHIDDVSPHKPGWPAHAKRLLNVILEGALEDLLYFMFAPDWSYKSTSGLWWNDIEINE